MLRSASLLNPYVNVGIVNLYSVFHTQQVIALVYILSCDFI